MNEAVRFAEFSSVSSDFPASPDSSDASDSPAFSDPADSPASSPEEDAALRRAREYLGRVARLDRRIEQKLRFQERLRSLATRVHRLPSSPPGDPDALSTVGRLRDLERETDRDVDHLVNLKNEIWEVLSRMENQEIALILDDRFLCGYSLQQTADRAGYSRRHVQRLIRWGLLEVDRMLREEKPMTGYFPHR